MGSVMHEALVNLANRETWDLVHSLDVKYPDSPESAGAEYVKEVRDSLVDGVQYAMESLDLDLEDAVEHIRDHGEDSTLASEAVPAYTPGLWAVFVDLGAYNEDLTEHGAPPADMTAGAQRALYMIASRLIGELLRELEQYC